MTTAEIIEAELRRLCPQMAGVETVAREVASTLEYRRWRMSRGLPAVASDEQPTELRISRYSGWSMDTGYQVRAKA